MNYSSIKWLLNSTDEPELSTLDSLVKNRIYRYFFQQLVTKIVCFHFLGGGDKYIKDDAV